MEIKLKDRILLVGAGLMAINHAKVLQSMDLDFIVVGRGEESARKFKEETGINVITGGIKKWINNNSKYPHHAIVAVSGTQLGNVTRSLIKFGISSILLEKPGGINNSDIISVAKTARKQNAKVLLGYNRRFYASTIRAQEIIQQDGGVTSFYFEFTEWPHTIIPLNKDPEEKKNWILHNSSHVIDLAFYLGGLPKKICSYSSGGFDWHPIGTIFTGAGETNEGVLFSYHSNWDAPGRWGVEILTKKHRLIFRPLETLKIQKLKSVAIEEEMIEDDLDHKFKPGLFLQLKSFLSGTTKSFLNIQEQASRLKILDNISKGGSIVV